MVTATVWVRLADAGACALAGSVMTAPMIMSPARVPRSPAIYGAPEHPAPAHLPGVFLSEAQYVPCSVTALLSDYDRFITNGGNELTLLTRASYRREDEADSTSGGDPGAGSCLLKLLPETGDVSINDVRARIKVHVPDFVVELAARDRFLRAEHQVFEKLELHRGEIHFHRTAQDAPV